MTNEEYKLTDEEWREFQSIPEQWFSHRAWVDARIAERVADERAKRPDREQIDRIQFEIDNVHQIHGDTCLCGFKSSRSRSRTEHLTALFAEAVLALEPETDQELQDRIEVLEKNLAYEVAQKIKLAEQLQAATATDLTLEQARWKMHAGIESRCSEEVAAEVKPVIDLVFSSLALEPEAREGKLERLAAVTNINSITKAMLEEVGYPSHFHPADAPSWAYSVLEEEHEARTAPEAREEQGQVEWGVAYRQNYGKLFVDEAVDYDDAVFRVANSSVYDMVVQRRVTAYAPVGAAPPSEASEEAEYFRDGDGDLWKFTDKGEWFHEEEPGEFRRVLSIDAEDQTLTPVGHAELAPAPEAREETVRVARVVHALVMDCVGE